MWRNWFSTCLFLFFVHMSKWIMMSVEFRAGPSGLSTPCHCPAWELPWDWQRVWYGKQRDPVANPDLYCLHRTCLLQTAVYLANTNGFTDMCWHETRTNTLHIHMYYISGIWFVMTTLCFRSIFILLLVCSENVTHRTDNVNVKTSSTQKCVLLVFSLGCMTFTVQNDVCPEFNFDITN